MTDIEREKPLSGRRLNEVLAWSRAASAAACYCEPSSREHKWGLVLETVHYALVQKELAGSMKNESLQDAIRRARYWATAPWARNSCWPDWNRAIAAKNGISRIRKGCWLSRGVMPKRARSAS